VKRKGVRVRILALMGLLAAGSIFMAGHYVMVRPSLRTDGYFVFFRAWHSHCPFAAGELWPNALARFFEPFVPIWVQIEPGVTMWLDPYDLVGGSILASGEWEPKTWHALQQHVSAGGTFVDVGAHIGWYSLKAAKLVGPKGRVIAVEPNHETLLRLRDNIRASGASAVIVVAPVACSDSETTLNFFAAPRANTGMSSLSLTNASRLGGIAASYQVRARRLDDIVREAGVARVDAVKIDVEGAEFLVLKGAVETLDRYRPVVSVELIDEGLKQMGASVDDVMAFMRSHGYAPQQYEEENVVFVPVAVP
jgi:FkbM family methyltransferase